MPIIQSAPQTAAEPLSDEELIARVRAGDTSLFEVLMRRNNQRLFRMVRAVLKDDAEAEDVMQQSYLLAFTHLGQFAAEGRFSTWLLRIGVNEALGRLRRQRRHLESLADPTGDEPEATPLEPRAPSPEDRAASRELAGLLEHTIDELPAAYRQVLMLRLVEGLDTAETASVLGLGEEAVKQRLHRARGMVQRAIEERVGASAAAAFQFQAPRCDRVVAAVMSRLPR